MKIIKDKKLIEHRVALQDLLIKKTAEFGDYIQRYKEITTELPAQDPKTEQALKDRIQSLAIIYLELQYGNYFYKQKADFRLNVINNVAQQYINEIKTKQIKNLPDHAIATIFIYIEQALQQEIKRLNHASN